MPASDAVPPLKVAAHPNRRYMMAGGRTHYVQDLHDWFRTTPEGTPLCVRGGDRTVLGPHDWLTSVERRVTCPECLARLHA